MTWVAADGNCFRCTGKDSCGPTAPILRVNPDFIAHKVTYPWLSLRLHPDRRCPALWPHFRTWEFPFSLGGDVGQRGEPKPGAGMAQHPRLIFRSVNQPPSPGCSQPHPSELGQPLQSLAGSSCFSGAWEKMGALMALCFLRKSGLCGGWAMQLCHLTVLASVQLFLCVSTFSPHTLLNRWTLQ